MLPARVLAVRALARHCAAHCQDALRKHAGTQSKPSPTLLIRDTTSSCMNGAFCRIRMMAHLITLLAARPVLTPCMRTLNEFQCVHDSVLADLSSIAREMHPGKHSSQQMLCITRARRSLRSRPCPPGRPQQRPAAAQRGAPWPAPRLHLPRTAQPERAPPPARRKRPQQQS